MDNEIGDGMAMGSKSGFSDWLSWFFRIILALTFVWAGVLKLVDPAGFSGSIATFQLLPESWINAVALGLPPFEILAGLLVLTRRGSGLGELARAA